MFTAKMNDDMMKRPTPNFAYVASSPEEGKQTAQVIEEEEDNYNFMDLLIDVAPSFAFESFEEKTKYVAQVNNMTIQPIVIPEKDEKEFVDSIDVHNQLTMDKPVLVFTALEKIFLSIENPKEVTGESIVALKRSTNVSIHYTVVIRPKARDVLEKLMSHYILILYTDDYFENTMLLAKVLEGNS